MQINWINVITVFTITLVIGLALSSIIFKQQNKYQQLISVDMTSQQKAAIEQAKENLPQFFSALNQHAGKKRDFSVRLSFYENGQTEHIWCKDLLQKGEQLFCHIAQKPLIATSFEYGERIVVDPKIITDWIYHENNPNTPGKPDQVGGYTIQYQPLPFSLEAL